MGVEVGNIKEQPSYFFISWHTNKHFWMANVLYETSVEKAVLENFVPSKECLDVQFFSMDDAKELPVYQTVKDFIGIFNPNNH